MGMYQVKYTACFLTRISLTRQHGRYSLWFESLNVDSNFKNW
jgi:hypothetical protein